MAGDPFLPSALWFRIYYCKSFVCVPPNMINHTSAPSSIKEQKISLKVTEVYICEKGMPEKDTFSDNNYTIRIITLYQYIWSWKTTIYYWILIQRAIGKNSYGMLCFSELLYFQKNWDSVTRHNVFKINFKQSCVMRLKISVKSSYIITFSKHSTIFGDISYGCYLYNFKDSMSK